MNLAVYLLLMQDYYSISYIKFSKISEALQGILQPKDKNSYSAPTLKANSEAKFELPVK